MLGGVGSTYILGQDGTIQVGKVVSEGFFLEIFVGYIGRPRSGCHLNA